MVSTRNQMKKDQIKKIAAKNTKQAKNSLRNLKYICTRDPIQTRSMTKMKNDSLIVPTLQLVKLTKNCKNTVKQPQNKTIDSNTVVKNVDVEEKRKLFYNQIAVDENFKTNIVGNSNSHLMFNKDRFGNLDGTKFDLGIDKAFNGKFIVVINLYNGLTFTDTEKALIEKGFTAKIFSKAPTVVELQAVLINACQLWIISDSREHLSNQHVDLIKQFFDSGRGVYLWGDNQPFYADINKIAKTLFNGKMHGDVPGGNVIQIQKVENKCGLIKHHLISTGLDYLFEGITIATIDNNPDLEPILYGTADNIVVSVYDKYGKRAILDGGFTRLYCNWDTAGTGRYVKNAAVWLANIENYN